LSLLWDIVVALGKILLPLGIIVGILSFLLIEEQKYRIRLILRIIRPRYSLRLQERCYIHPDNLGGKAGQHIRFHGLQLRQREVPPYDIKLFTYEPVNRWTCRWALGSVHNIDWNKVTQPTVRKPRVAWYWLIEKGSGVNIGCIGINRDQDNAGDESLVYRFKCLGVTIGKGKISVP